jgi:hypothetical protein
MNRLAAGLTRYENSLYLTIYNANLKPRKEGKMNLALLLLLVAQAEGAEPPSCPLPTFQLMLDSAQLVVIGKVDSMWYSVDERGEPWTNVLAELLTVYAKNDSLPVPKGSIHIAKYGGICSDGSVVEILPSPSFKIGEVFLAAVSENPGLSSKTERVYRTFSYWKYTIANDSILLYYSEPGLEPPSLSLAEVISALSSNLIKKETQ